MLSTDLLHNRLVDNPFDEHNNPGQGEDGEEQHDDQTAHAAEIHLALRPGPDTVGGVTRHPRVKGVIRPARRIEVFFGRFFVVPEDHREAAVFIRCAGVETETIAESTSK